MKQLVRCVLAVTAILATACGGGSSTSFKTTAPAGTFAGQSWTMSKATVQKNSDGTLMVTLLSDPNAPDCATSQDSGGYIIWSMPATVGTRPLKLSLTDLTSPDNQTVTFVTPPSQNDISVDGAVGLAELTATTATVEIAATIQDKFDVNGTIKANLCQ